MGLPLMPEEPCFDCIYHDPLNEKCKKHNANVTDVDICFSFIKKDKV